MQKEIHSKIMGSFKYDEQFNTYEHTEGKVYYTLRRSMQGLIMSIV